MTKSQNTKDEQQKDLCITSEQLTEQWKNGQLESFRWYYVKFKTGEIDICWLTEWSNDELGTGGQYFDGIEEKNIIEVLAEVPSYEEWQEYKNANDSMFDTIKMLNKDNYKLEEENTKLKELLKEAEKREDIVRKELKDAQKVMIGDYSSLNYLKGVLSRQEIGNYTAQESLEKIAHDWEKDLDKYCKKWCKIKY